MSVLKDGRFIFIDAARHLRATTDTARGPSAHGLLYGGEITAFAVNATETRVALACPSNAATGTDPAECADPSKCCVRVFTLTMATTPTTTLGDLVAEQEAPAADGLVWLGDWFLIVSSPRAATTVMEVTKKDKLRVVVQDKGTHPFVLGGLLGLVAAAPAGKGTTAATATVVEMWDLHRNKRVATLRLARKAAPQRGKPRSGGGGHGGDSGGGIVSTCGSGPFAVLGHAAGSFDTLHATGKGAVKLLPRTRGCTSNGGGGGGGGNQRHKNSSNSSSRPVVMCRAGVPASTLIVGSAASHSISLFRYCTETEALVEEGAMTLLNDNNSEETLLALGAPTPVLRCLVQRPPQQRRAGKTVYEVRPVVFAPIPRAEEGGAEERAKSPTAKSGPTAGEEEDDSTAGKKKRKRNRKQKGASNDDDGKGEGEAKPQQPGSSAAANGAPAEAPKKPQQGGIPAVAIVVGVSFTAAAIVAVRLFLANRQ